jgi:hypothetical protein
MGHGARSKEQARSDESRKAGDICRLADMRGIHRWGVSGAKSKTIKYSPSYFVYLLEYFIIHSCPQKIIIPQCILQNTYLTL